MSTTIERLSDENFVLLKQRNALLVAMISAAIETEGAGTEVLDAILADPKKCSEAVSYAIRRVAESKYRGFLNLPCNMGVPS